MKTILICVSILNLVTVIDFGLSNFSKKEDFITHVVAEQAVEVRYEFKGNRSPAIVSINE